MDKLRRYRKSCWYVFSLPPHCVLLYITNRGSHALSRPAWIYRNKRGRPGWFYLLGGIFKTNVGKSVGHFKCVRTRGESPGRKETAAMTPTEKLSHPQRTSLGIDVNHFPFWEHSEYRRTKSRRITSWVKSLTWYSDGTQIQSWL